MINHRARIAYAIGFLSSIILSLAAYWIVVGHVLSGLQAVVFITILALVQCTMQLLFFLHLGSDTRPRWKLLSFLFMLLILCIIVIGSLWIMHSLNYRMNMTPEKMNEYMQSQVGI